jgi:hypothetical protein
MPPADVTPAGDAATPEPSAVPEAESASPRGRPRLSRTRSITAWVLVVLVSVLLPLSVMSFWAINTVTNTNKYVETMAPIASNPIVIDHTSVRITDKLFSSLNVQNRITNLLPPKAKPIVAPLTNTLNSFVEKQVHKVLSSSFFQKVWNNGNRRVHSTLVAVLTGQNTKTTRALKNGAAVVVDITPVANKAIDQLDARGVTIFDPLKKVFSTQNGRLSISLASQQQVQKASGLFNLVKKLQVGIPIATLVLAAAGVALAVRRRKTLVRMTLGGAIGIVVLLVGLDLTKRQFISKAVDQGYNGQVAEIIFNTLLRFLKDGLWLVLGILVVMAVVEWFVGPARYAVALRHQIARAWGWLVRNVKHVTDKEHRGAVSAGSLRTARWIREHRSGLRLLGALVAGIFLVFSGNLSFGGLLVAVLILAAYIGLLQLVVLWADRVDIGTGPSGNDDGTAKADPAGVGSGTTN